MWRRRFDISTAVRLALRRYFVSGGQQSEAAAGHSSHTEFQWGFTAVTFLLL